MVKNELKMRSNIASTPEARPGQTLMAHSQAVGSMCKKIADSFSAPACGMAVGFGHDWGKLRQEWQTYLHSNAERGSVSHAPQSVVELFRVFSTMKMDILGTIFAYCAYGHHSSLPNWHEGLDTFFSKGEDATAMPAEYADVIAAAMPSILAELKHDSPDQMPFLIRMLFSALVDSDRLDAEKFETPQQGDLRGRYDAWETLEASYDLYMQKLSATNPPGKVNALRAEIRRQCEIAADKSRGLFSLNVPTGGGKTLSSMAFALKHRKIHQMGRIIYAIPFNSIIEQTAHIYKDIFGEGNVLEHHHSFVPPEGASDELRRKYELAAENWDMPIVVTTTVQLFESLLQGTASGSRKLHNLVNSIIILDEAQKLPPEHLNALLTTLRVLAERFGCTVVLCSATIPAIEGDFIGRERYQIQGLPEVRKIIVDPERLEAEMRRTKITMVGELSLKEIAERIEKQSQVLCIVNTKRRCIELFLQIHSPNKYHLSASMCPADRQETLRKIRSDLAQGKEIVIIATSLIEAGVDLDVQCVFREIAGVDSIAQAAGRCNREGKRQVGDVYVFSPQGEVQPRGMQSFAANAALDSIGDEAHPEMNQTLYRRYFERYYAKCGNLLRQDGYEEAFQNPLQYQFRDFGESFHMINDEGQVPLVVLFGDSGRLIEALRANGPSRDLFRKLGLYTINIREKDLEKLKGDGIVENVYGVFVQTAPGIYVPGVGFQLEHLASFQL